MLVLRKSLVVLVTVIFSSDVAEAICHISKQSPLKSKTGNIEALQGYNDNQQCEWNFSPAQQWNAIRIYIDSHHIEVSTNCTKDVLRVHDERICGEGKAVCLIFTELQRLDQCQPKLLSKGCDVRSIDNWPPKIAFQTDESGTDDGFTLSYSFHKCKQWFIQPRITLIIDEKSGNGKAVPTESNLNSSRPLHSLHSTAVIVVENGPTIGSPGPSIESGEDLSLMVILILSGIILLLAAILITMVLRRRRQQQQKCTTDTTTLPASRQMTLPTAYNEDVYEDISDKRMTNSSKISEENHYGMVENIVYGQHGVR